jgi:hypothetical protein
MMKRIGMGMLAAVLSAAAVLPANAQVFTPTYQSPRLLDELGIYLSDGPGDLGIEGIWRGGPLGLRVGFVDAADGLLSVGGELRSPIRVTTAPLGLAFVAAAQGLIGDESAVGVQGGLTAGHTFRADGMLITPYMHPRIAMVKPIRGPDDFDLEVMADVGFDVEMRNNLVLRLGITLGSVGADWGVGLAWRR